MFEWTGRNFSAYVPDLPGCITTGATMDETTHNMREAIDGHIAAMWEYGESIPEAMTMVEAVAVTA